DVRPVPERLEDAPLGARRLCDGLDVVLGVEDAPQTGAHNRVIVDDENTNHCRGTSATRVVPVPGTASIVILPPTSATRSRMPTRPRPPVALRAGSNPLPSSS